MKYFIDRYYGYGQAPYGYPPGPPGSGFPMGYPGGPNVAFFPVPTYYYPPHGMPQRGPEYDVAVVDDGPIMPGETVELPYCKSLIIRNLRFLKSPKNIRNWKLRAYSHWIPY